MKMTPDRVPASPEPKLSLLPYQQEDVDSDARFQWCCWSRQTGKSFAKSLRRLLRGLARNTNQILLSAGERQSRELMAKARQHCQFLKIAFNYYERPIAGFSYKSLEILLPGGVRMIGLPANPQTARGYSGDVLLDEFAMHLEDRAIWASLFPALLRGSGELDVASTPRGLNNVFAELRSNEQFSHSTITLYDAIEQGLEVDAQEVRAALADETLFRQEFLCEFLDEAHAFLPWEAILNCEDEKLCKDTSFHDLKELRSDLYAGMDIGRKRDLTVIWVVSREGSKIVTRAVHELANSPFRQQEGILKELMTMDRVRRCCIDSGGLGMPLAENAVEQFGSHRVEAVTFTPAVRSEMAGQLKIAVEGGSLRIPRNEAIRRDLHSLRRVLSSSGHFRLEAPRGQGSHADRFWAAALALRAASAAESGVVEAKYTSPASFTKSGSW